MRFDEETKSLTYSDEAQNEDDDLDEEDEVRMARVLLPAMNSINPDVQFTSETASDFSNKWLPTLDTKLKVVDNCRIEHNYFEKEMKTPLVIMNRSAMGQQQRHSILSNELIRRLSNVE